MPPELSSAEMADVIDASQVKAATITLLKEMKTQIEAGESSMFATIQIYLKR